MGVKFFWEGSGRRERGGENEKRERKTERQRSVCLSEKWQEEREKVSGLHLLKGTWHLHSVRVVFAMHRGVDTLPCSQGAVPRLAWVTRLTLLTLLPRLSDFSHPISFLKIYFLYSVFLTLFLLNQSLNFGILADQLF